MLALQIGAGNIGRGFIGQVLHEAGYTVCFADINDTLIEQLQAQKSYKVELAGNETQTINVTNIEAVHNEKQEEALLEKIAQADLITTAVGPNVLRAIAPILAEGLKRRLKQGEDIVNVIACENMVGATEQLRHYVWEHLSSEEKAQAQQFIGFPNAAVDRIVPAQPGDDDLTVKVEAFFEWVVDQTEIKGELPPVPAITYVDELMPYVERKLFTVNTGHAALAYNGFVQGTATIKEAIENDNVRQAYEAVIAETGELLVQKYGFTKEDMQTYHRKISSRFQNPHISDSVERVGRGPIRKVHRSDRLVKPAVELNERNIQPKAIAATIARLLEFDPENDQEANKLQEDIQAMGKRDAFIKYSELENSHPLVDLVMVQ
ncbi:mannitol-1-phosphate 5-dehydrogenase [Alteribacillus persepolensis]|uniref:Mannitol-1-phosphate 5-dehydrogenase n=1 Tax=Alteribacillus persepolensis TaxID=568899 RepID=A0A1G8GBZ8_9BACI|nr:mannitol-1-phosphate 5-dehydrogenase [Alteribacillus persepolensis]SDH91873.1 mannitol-1-phosphate 5-dehydrogenase [Alteribacillus persepolensis]